MYVQSNKGDGLVSDKRRANGEKVQSIEIHYRFIGNLTDGRMGQQFNKKSNLAVKTDFVGYLQKETSM